MFSTHGTSKFQYFTKMALVDVDCIVCLLDSRHTQYS